MIEKDLLDKLDTSRKKDPKKFMKHGKKMVIRHLGSIRTECEVVGHSWEYRKGQQKGESTLLFGRERCTAVFPPKLVAAVHIIDINGQRRRVVVNDLSVVLEKEMRTKDIPAEKKSETVDDGRRYFQVGGHIPVVADVWEDQHVETIFDVASYQRKQKKRKKN